MTDLEKAKEIQKNDVCVCWNGGCPNVCNGAMKMAAWKQEQMIEKAVEWLEPIFKDLAGYDCGGDLVEDFKKVMKEG